MTVRVIGPKDPWVQDAIDTTSRSGTWSRGLSPFFLGPIPLYPGAVVPHATCMENAWQGAKVYPIHVGPIGDPFPAYFQWAKDIWEDPQARRYPMGKGVSPAYSWWAGERLRYVDARRRIYIPLYAQAVVTTGAFQRLLALYREVGRITLWDFDGYDHQGLGMTLKDVVGCETRKMGHAFVLAHLLDKLR